MRFESPLKAELHWKGYGETASPDADAWEVEERPILLPPGGGSYGTSQCQFHKVCQTSLRFGANR